MKTLTLRNLVLALAAFFLLTLGSSIASAQPRINGGKAIEKSVFTEALKDRKVATAEEAKAFTTLFSSRDIAQCSFSDLTSLMILWQPGAKPQPTCLKDAIIQVETLNSGQVVGTAYSRVEVPYPDAKGMIIPFDNRRDDGTKSNYSVRITILPAGSTTIVTITLAITRM